MDATVKKALRLTGTAVLVIVVIRIMDWLLAPALPLLVALFLLGTVLYVAIYGRRGL
jgi:hypothetical protein